MAKYTLGELIWKITGDSSGLNDSLDKSDKKLEKTRKSFVSVGGIIKTAFVAALGVGGKKLISLASDAEETGNKFDVTFSKIKNQADEAAQALSDGYGLSSLASQKLLSDTGDLLTGFGFTQESALDLSTEVNKLAVDLASFTNYAGGAEGASDALTKALLGERESVKSLGIAILDADVKAKVLENTQAGLTFETDRQAQAYATLQLAQEQSKNAIGDFERSEASFANQTRIATANIEDQGVALGTALLPYANVAVTAFNELSETTAGLVSEFQNFATDGENVATIANAIGIAAGTVSTAFIAFKTFVEEITGGLDGLGETFTELTSAINDTENDFNSFDIVMATAIASGNVLGEVIGAIVTNVLNLAKVLVESGQIVSSFVNGLAGGGWDDFKRNLSEGKDAVVDLGSSIKNAFVDVGTAIGESTAEIVMNYDTLGDELESKVKSTSEAVAKTVETAVTKAKTDTEDAVAGINKSIESTAQTTKDTGEEIEAAAIDTGNAVVAATEEAQTALDSLSDGGLILYMLNGGKSDDEIEETIANRFNYIASLAADTYSTVTDIVNDYYDNELDRIENNLSEYESAMDAELAAKIAKLDADVLGEDAYNSAVEALENEYQNRKDLAEIEAARASYEIEKKQFKASQAFDVADIQMKTAVAVMQAYAQLGPIAGTVAAALIGVLGAVQVAQVLTQEPPARPTFENGGIVPAVAGVPSTGDNVTVGVNPGEVILNQAQQSNLVSQMGGNTTINLTVVTPDKKTLYKGMYDASKRREFLIDVGAVVSK